MPRTNLSINTPPSVPACHTTTGASVRRPGATDAALFDRKRLVDQLLSVGNLGCELFIGAVLRNLDPRVVFRRSQRDNLDIVLLEGGDHLVVETLGGLVEILLRLLASIG